MTDPDQPKHVHPILDVLHGCVHIATFLRESADAADEDETRRAVLAAQAVSYTTVAALIIEALQRVEDDNNPTMDTMHIGRGHIWGIAAIFCSAGKGTLPNPGEPCAHGNTVHEAPICATGKRLARAFCTSVLDWGGALRPYVLAAVNDPARFQMARLHKGELDTPQTVEYEPDDETVQQLISLPCHLGIGEGPTCLHGNPVPDDERPCELGFATAEALTRAISPGGPLHTTATYLLCGMIPEGFDTCTPGDCHCDDGDNT